ncbi:MAG: aspartate aminotransferase family protein [Anaerolineae bacterium]|nr:aspartate aminotransferase family protein [Anaerolineae bacterium]
MNTIALEQQHDAGTYPKRDVAIVRGEGAFVWDEAGRRYIDCVGGHGVVLLGHCHPAVTAAICQQAQTLVTCPGIFYNDVRAQLLTRLAKLTGLERGFLCNSGAEAVEGAFKFARLSSGRTGIVATMRGFHGRTMGALSATWEPKYREPFLPLVPGFDHAPYDNIDKMAEAVNENTAAVIVEIVQGEGGVRPGGGDFFRSLRKLCDEQGMLLIVDEIQTGLGRTGKMFAFQHHGIRPDILCLGKGIGGGVPMGAVMLSDKIGNIHPGVHGSTFGGNPLACAAALATLDALEKENLVQQSADKGAYLLEKLRAIPSPMIREVRGLGLMVGIELRTKSQPYLEALIDQGVLALPAGTTVIRLLPPLIIGYEELDRVVAAIETVLTT